MSGTEIALTAAAIYVVGFIVTSYLFHRFKVDDELQPAVIAWPLVIVPAMIHLLQLIHEGVGKLVRPSK
jgi:hypothetical protein